MKRTPLLRINQPSTIQGGTTSEDYTELPDPPALPAIPAPEDLDLDSTLSRSAVTPSAIVSATWEPALGTNPQFYDVQWSTSSDFPTSSTSGTRTSLCSLAIDGLRTGITYYVRVAAWYSAVRSDFCEAVSETTPTDTTPPDAPDDAAWTWQDTGDLVVTWTEPGNANLRDIEIRVWDSAAKGTLYTVAYSSTGIYTWTLTENLKATSGAPDAAVYIELKSRSWGGYLSVAVTPATQPTKAAPSAPAGLTTSWDSDAGTAGPDCLIAWTASAGATRYTLTIDGVARTQTGTRYTYTLDTNRAEHSGTPDKALTVSVVAIDALGQTSSASTTTATNVAPPTPDAPTITAGFSAMQIALTASTAADIDSYRLRITKDTLVHETITTSSLVTLYKATGAGAYAVYVTAVDGFGQVGTESAAGSATLDALTIEQLRSEADYTDSDSNTPATLAVLKDGATGAGVTYSGGVTHWVQIARATAKLYRRISLALGSGTAKFYIATSLDGSTWRFFAHTGADHYTQTEYGAEVDAQINASLVATLTYGFAELPGEIEARFIKVYHWDTSSYRLDECYPRTRLTIDDIDAEFIRGMTISGNQLIVNQLSALTASMGALTIDDMLTIATTGSVYQGTYQPGHDGDPTYPYTGLKIWNDSGIGRLATYYQGVVQVYLDSTGRFSCGGGNFVFDANGQVIAAQDQTSFTYDATRTITWTAGAGGSAVGYIGAHYDSLNDYNALCLDSPYTVAPADRGGHVELTAEGYSKGAYLSIGGNTTNVNSISAITMGAMEIIMNATGILVAIAHNLPQHPLDVYGAICSRKSDDDYLLMSAPATGRGEISHHTNDAAAAYLDINAIGLDGQPSYVRLNRSADTSADAAVNVYVADGTATAQTSLGCNRSSYINAVNGGLSVGTTAVAGDGEILATGAIYPNYTAGGPRLETKVIGSLANGGLAQVLNVSGNGDGSFGRITIFCGAGYIGDFNVLGGANTTQEVSDPTSKFSVTKDTASSTNVYWSAANSRYEIQNKSGAPQNYYLVLNVT